MFPGDRIAKGMLLARINEPIADLYVREKQDRSDDAIRQLRHSCCPRN